MKPRCQASGGPFSRATSISGYGRHGRGGHRNQALGDERPVVPGQGRDSATVPSAHGAACRTDPARAARRPEVTAAQFPVHRDQRDQHEPDGGKMAVAGEIVRPVRFHQRIDLGQFVAGLVTVDDGLRACRASVLPPTARCWWCAIDGDSSVAPLQRARAPPRRWGHSPRRCGRGRGSRIEPAMAQMPAKQRRRGRSVDVVVAEDRDLLGTHRRVGNAPRRHLHRRHGVGIGISLRMVGSESPRPRRSRHRGPPHARQHLRQLERCVIASAAPPPWRRAGRATICRSPAAARRETPAAVQREGGCGKVMIPSKIGGKRSSAIAKQGDGEVHRSKNRAPHGSHNPGDVRLSFYRQKRPAQRRCNLLR